MSIHKMTVSDNMTLEQSTQIITDEIAAILGENLLSIYLYGSVVLNDFCLGWSDIDILVLTHQEISENHADTLVGLRQNLLEKYPGNPYFRLFEGGMLSLDALLNNTKECTVYWGTSGQRITDSYKMDSFGMAELLDSGILLHGDDIRGKMIYPSYAQMRDDIARHVQAARKHGVVVGWLLDIARGIYTLRTGKIIAKTAAGEWALENNLCPDTDAMQKAIQCRKAAHLMQEKSIDNSIIQRFADIIDVEFVNMAERFAQSELQRMNIAYDTLSLIRIKDGVSVWRVNTENGSVVMSFDEVTALVFEDDYNFESDEEYQNLRRSIAQMSAAYRDIIVMHYYDNLSCKAISQKLGMPEGTIMYRLSMARNKIKEGCNQMNETALKPAQLKIRIHGEGNYNGEDRPFPWQYIDDALSQNILWYSYREPKTVEELSSLTGVPAFYIEDRIDNLIKREAVIQSTKKTVQANFLIFDKEINAYAPAHSSDFAATVSEDFYRLSLQLAEKMLSSGLQISNRNMGEFQCLLSVMLLDKFVPDYRPTEYKRFETRYDGGRWEYTGFYNDGSCGGDVGISMEKSMNNFEHGKLAHYSYHFAPFAYRKMMFSHEIDVCQAVLQGQELSEAQKETAAKLIADGYLAKDESGKVVCAVPVFTKEQYDLFLVSVKTILAGFLPFYAEEVKKYLDGYIKLFPKHLKDATERNGFHVFVAIFKAVAANWLRSGKINIPNGAVCDALIMM